MTMSFSCADDHLTRSDVRIAVELFLLDMRYFK